MKSEGLLSDIQDVLGANPDTAAVATEAYLRGRLRVEQERNAEAVVAFTEALKARTALHGADHLAVAEILADFGQLLSFEEKFDASERLLKQGLDFQTRNSGQTPPQVSVTLSFLALLVESRGDAEHALQIQEANPDHLRTAITLFTL